MSHTVTVKTEFKNREAFGRAAEKLGGTVLGEGTHHLYDGDVEGFGVTLPNLYFPLVLQANGTLKYDGDYGRIVDQLKPEYIMATAEAKCEELGWMHERRGNDLVLLLGQGREIVVTPDGTVDAMGFQGTGCAEAVNQIASAIGSTVTTNVKPEFGQVVTETKTVI